MDHGDLGTKLVPAVQHSTLSVIDEVIARSSQSLRPSSKLVRASFSGANLAMPAAAIAAEAAPRSSHSLRRSAGLVLPSVTYAPSVRFRGGTASNIDTTGQAIDSNGNISEAVQRETGIIQYWG